MEKIGSIKFDKKASEYFITYRSPDGTKSIVSSNRLLEAEKQFARTAKHFSEFDDCVIWC